MRDHKGLNLKIYTVSELNSNIRKNLETSYFDIWLEGEVSNFYFQDKKHMYFDLKDENSKIRVVMFHHNNKNLLFEIEEGMHILINGYISVYEKRGEYQLIALDARPVGKGSLILAFEHLKEKLEKKGYFESIYKKRIPIIPGKIGVATSVGGAVIRDIISVLKRRFENFHLILRDVNVQGITSADEICSAIDDLIEYGVDVIIVARGGGSLEDLWAFNTEKLAEKIFNCPIPVISAVGHETDYTISDFVADKRAATPSVAGEIVIINKEEALEDLKEINEKIKNLLKSEISKYKREIDFLINRRVLMKPELILRRFDQYSGEARTRLVGNLRKILNAKKESVSEHYRRLDERRILKRIYAFKMEIENKNIAMVFNIKNYLISKKSGLKMMLKNLQDNNPIAVLRRGFALIYKEKIDENIKDIGEVKINQKVRIMLRDGVMKAKIFEKIYKKLELGFKNEN
jgi:exodeoxyribonuclease VII large subunit